MKTWRFLLLQGLFSAVSVSLASPVGKVCRSTPLSDETVRRIAVTEFEKRGAKFDVREWHYEIRREECSYIFIAKHIPPVPGAHFVVEIDETGEVQHFGPGL